MHKYRKINSNTGTTVRTVGAKVSDLTSFSPQSGIRLPLYYCTL